MTDIMKLVDNVTDYALKNDTKSSLNARAALQSAIEALQGENASLLQQAQIWKQEATAQRATVHEAYRVCTGNTGEPGDWNGAEPIRKLAAERDALQAKLSALQVQEPVLFIHPATFGMNSAHVGAWKPGHELAGYLPLYAALQTREPVHITPKGASAAAQLRAMATNYPAGHLWDKLDAQACIRGALEIEALRAAPKALALEPLTDEQMDKGQLDYVHSTADFKAGARFAEKHHGIGGTP